MKIKLTLKQRSNLYEIIYRNRNHFFVNNFKHYIYIAFDRHNTNDILIDIIIGSSILLFLLLYLEQKQKTANKTNELLEENNRLLQQLITGKVPPTAAPQPKKDINKMKESQLRQNTQDYYRKLYEGGQITKEQYDSFLAQQQANLNAKE